MFWTIVPFLCLLAVTAIFCFFYKKSHGEGLIRIPSLILLVLSYFYVSVSALGWGYVGFQYLTGWTWGWAAATYFGFWFVPWIKGAAPFRFVFIFTIDGAINFDRVNLCGSGFMTGDGLISTIFWARGKQQRAAMKEMVTQIMPQLREQIKNPIKRWRMFHWRWYAPLTGGYASFNKDFSHHFDDIIHNTYKFPITRFCKLGPLAGVSITEVNT